MLIDDRFTCIAQLGQGASSTVWRARDERTAQLVALKLFADEPDAQLRMHREIEALSALSHPRLPRMIACKSRDGTQPAYIAMPLFEGTPLRAALATRPTERSVRALALAVCDPLSALHERGLVHRDLKPEHVILDSVSDFSAVSLIDLGLALAASDPRQLTANNIVGTLGYLPPEQLRAPAPLADPRWDVFSLGALLFEFATGVAPFSAPDRGQLVARMLALPAPSARERCATPITAALDALLQSMLSVDPVARPRDARAVREAVLALPAIHHETADDLQAIAVIVGHATRASAQQTTDTVITDEPRVERALLPSNAWVTETADGAVLIVLRAPAVDAALVTRAIQCALLLSDADPSRAWTASASIGTLRDRWPRGAALDRALALRSASCAGSVVIDEHTALFAEGAFSLTRARGAFVVVGARGV